MKQIIYYILILKTYILFILIPFNCYAQLVERLKNTTKNVIENTIDQKVERGVQKGLEDIEKSMKKNGTKKQNDRKTSIGKEKEVGTSKKDAEIKLAENQSSTKNQNFEFVAGDQVLYAENFKEDVLGELPLNWFTNNVGKVTESSFADGKWFLMYPSSQYLSPIFKDKLPENFSIEFDINLALQYQGYVYPEIQFGLIENIAGDKDGRKYFIDDRAKSSIHSLNFTIFPAEEAHSLISYESYQNGSLYFKKEGQSLQNIHKKFGKKIKVSIWVQKNRIRLWFDQDKIFDIPQGVAAQSNLNRLLFQISSSIQNENEVGVYISNIRVAASTPDMRTKFKTEGKFSTDAILFDSNADIIKPASYPVLKDIAAILKENGNTPIKIVGHTDSDGSTESNQQLSEKRALAVKRHLVEKYGIASEKLITSGEGELKPVASNLTEEGKKQNRRVEFIKM